MENLNEMMICIEFIYGKEKVLLECENHQTIEEIQIKLEAIFHLPKKFQRWIWKGKDLTKASQSTSMPLSSYSFSSKTKIMILPKKEFHKENSMKKKSSNIEVSSSESPSPSSSSSSSSYLFPKQSNLNSSTNMNWLEICHGKESFRLFSENIENWNGNQLKQAIEEEIGIDQKEQNLVMKGHKIEALDELKTFLNDNSKKKEKEKEGKCLGKVLLMGNLAFYIGKEKEEKKQEFRSKMKKFEKSLEILIQKENLNLENLSERKMEWKILKEEIKDCEIHLHEIFQQEKKKKIENTRNLELLEQEIKASNQQFQNFYQTIKSYYPEEEN